MSGLPTDGALTIQMQVLWSLDSQLFCTAPWDWRDPTWGPLPKACSSQEFQVHLPSHFTVNLLFSILACSYYKLACAMLLSAPQPCAVLALPRDLPAAVHILNADNIMPALDFELLLAHQCVGLAAKACGRSTSPPWIWPCTRSTSQAREGLSSSPTLSKGSWKKILWFLPYPRTDSWMPSSTFLPVATQQVMSSETHAGLTACIHLNAHFSALGSQW